MYSITVFNKSGEATCTFDCASLTESYDNSVRRRTLTAVVKHNLNSFIESLSPMEGIDISKIVVTFNEEAITEYTAYKVYNRASIEYPEGDPKEVQGVVNFTTM